MNLNHAYVAMLTFLFNRPGFTPAEFEERLNSLGDELPKKYLPTILIFLRVRALVAANRYVS